MKIRYSISHLAFFLSRISHFFSSHLAFFNSHLAFLTRISHFFISHLAFFISHLAFLTRISHFGCPLQASVDTRHDIDQIIISERTNLAPLLPVLALATRLVPKMKMLSGRSKSSPKNEIALWSVLMTITLRDDGPGGVWPGMQRGEAPVEWPPKQRRGPD